MVTIHLSKQLSEEARKLGIRGVGAKGNINSVVDAAVLCFVTKLISPTELQSAAETAFADSLSGMVTETIVPCPDRISS
jgi:hypothetical protein